MIRNLLALVGLAAIGLIAAIALQASDYFADDAPPRIAVSYAGLDLGSPEGVRLLESRINGAVDRICSDRGRRGLQAWQNERECRRAAIASVEPQAAAAIDRARRHTDAAVDRDYDDRPTLPPHRYEDEAPPPAYPAADEQRPVEFDEPDEVVQRVPPEYAEPPARRRPAAARPAPAAKRAVPPAHARKPARPPRRAYARLAPVPGSWLPPSAWSQIDRATARAFATGRLTRWIVRDREGYVTVSAARWIGGCACRNVRAVKYADGRQIVVASGLRCRLPGGGFR